jgi:hypothetical protein
VNIRPLKTADVFTVIGMLKKIGKTRLADIFTSDVSATKTAKPDAGQSIQLGILVLTELYDNVIGDLQGWFASLIGKTFDEYMELPPQTTLEIIDGLVDSEETKGFFSHALQLYKKMNLLGNRSNAK